MKKNLISQLEEYATKNKIKITEQRRIIAKVIEKSQDHPNVESLFQRAKKIDDKISIATTYRTIKLLEDANLIDKHDFGDGKSRYELAGTEHHDHLIDIETGEVVEFHDEELEELKEKVAEKLGYKLIDHRLELFAKKIT